VTGAELVGVLLALALLSSARKPPPGPLGLTIYPVAGASRVISGYGPRGDAFHYGVDIGAPLRARALACVAGAVRFGTDPKGGNIAIVKSRLDGAAFYYAHLSEQTGDGREVEAGEQIGAVGMSGNAAHTTPHLHFEFWPSGTYEREPPDPTPFLATAKKVA